MPIKAMGRKKKRGNWTMEQKTQETRVRRLVVSRPKEKNEKRRRKKGAMG